MGLFSWLKGAFNFGHLYSEVLKLTLELDKVKARLAELAKETSETTKRVDRLENEIGAAEDHEPAKDFRYHENLLWLSGDPEPYCPRCREVEGNAVHMFLGYDFGGKEKKHRYCSQCNYNAPDGKSPFS